MSDLVKRIVLSRFWVGDRPYHRVHGEQGLITSVQFSTDRLVPRYYCVFNQNSDGWTDEMELSPEPIFEKGANV